MSNLVFLEKDKQGIATLTLNRPEKRNALNIALLQEIIVHLKKLHQENDTRVLIIKGNGSAFCSGLDLGEACDLAVAQESAHLVNEVFKRLYHLPIITIAAVHGSALAGGAGLPALCDYAIAAEGTQFGFPEVKRGIVASLILTFLIRFINERDLKELFLFGDLIDATRAQELRLINQVVPFEDLQHACQVRAESALRGSPHAITCLKRLFKHYSSDSLERDLEEALNVHRLGRTHQEAVEGMKAFLEKRAPAWEKK